jgi:hypothetical protein
MSNDRYAQYENMQFKDEQDADIYYEDDEEILVDVRNLVDFEKKKEEVDKNNPQITIKEIRNINKESLYKKLENVEKIKDCYKANDVIDILSNNKERDKRLIGGYTRDEVVLKKTICNGFLRTTRFLTQKGIERYLHEGKIFSYENACSYFAVKPKDLDIEKWNIQLEKIKIDDEDNITEYKTSLILKWLFEKRKFCKTLGENVSIESLLEWIDDAGIVDEISNKKKLNHLRDMK